MDDTSVDEWMSFFQDAGIPPNVSASYASSFFQNRIHFNMILELNRDLLKELGVNLVGDAIAILRHVKSFHEQNVRQKILNNIMSSECQKSPECNKKLSLTEVASKTTNSNRIVGGIGSQIASPLENNHSGITAACRNSNNQEVLRLRQQSQLTPTKKPLQRYGISTSRPATASLSQTDNITQNNISVATLQREALQLCETFVPASGETDTIEEMNAPCNASRIQNNLQTSCSENFPMREPVESTRPLPLRKATVPTRVSGSNYACRRNQSLKRAAQQSPCSTIVSTSQQSAPRLPYRTSKTATNCQSGTPMVESNSFPDEHDEILLTPSIKRKRTLSYYGLHEQEQFDPNVCTQSIGMRVARKSVYETQNTTETGHSEGSHVKEVSLPRQDLKNEVIVAEDHTVLEPRCQPSLQRRQEESPIQICTEIQSQERMHILHSHSRMSHVTSVPHSSKCPQGNGVQRPICSFANARCSNKSILKESDNIENEELAQIVLKPHNATCVSSSGSEIELIGPGRDLVEEGLSSLSDLNTERSAVRWDSRQLFKPVANSSLYEDSSSHTFNNIDGHMSSSDYTENNLQQERVPGQIFSRLGVKVELVSMDNNVCNTAVKNDALPSSRLSVCVKSKRNKSKKHKSLSNKFAKIMTVKHLPKTKLLKRKIVFKAFQKASTAGRQNAVPDQTPLGATPADGGQLKLRGILKPQTISSQQQEEEQQSSKMTANMLLESVAGSGTTGLGMVSDAVHYDSTKSADGDLIFQNTDDFCSDDEQQEELDRAPTSGMCKTVRFGPVCIKEFEKNVLPLSGKTATNSRPPIFCRLGTRKKGI